MMDQAENKNNFKTAYLFGLSGALLVIFAYFIPWVGVDSQSTSEKAATYTKSAYGLGKLSDDQIAAVVVEGLAKKSAVNSVIDAYRIKTRETADVSFSEIFNVEATKKLTPAILTLEKSGQTLVAKVLEDVASKDNLIKTGVEAEKKAFEDIVKNYTEYFDMLSKISLDKIKDQQFTDMDLAREFARILDEMPPKDEKDEPDKKDEPVKPKTHVKDMETVIAGIENQIALLETCNLLEVFAGSQRLAPVLLEKYARLYSPSMDAELTASERDMKKALLAFYGAQAPNGSYSDKIVAMGKQLEKTMDAVCALGEKNIFNNKVTKIDSLVNYIALLQDEVSKVELKKGLARINVVADALETYCFQAVATGKISDEEVKRFLSESIAPSIANADVRDEAAAALSSQFAAMLKQAPKDAPLDRKYFETFPSRLDENGKKYLKELKNPELVCRTVLSSLSVFLVVDKRVSRDDVVNHIAGRLNSDKDAVASMESVVDTLLLFNEKEVANATSFRLMLNNDIYMRELLKTPGLAPLVSGIDTYLSAYALVNKCGEKDFDGDTLLGSVKNRLYDTYYSQAFPQHENCLIDQTLFVPPFTAENMAEGRLASGPRKSVIWNLFLGSSQDATLGKYIVYANDPVDDYYGFYAIIRENAMAGSLGKTTIARDTFRNSLSEKFSDLLMQGMVAKLVSTLGEPENLPKVIEAMKDSLGLDDTKACKVMKLYYENKDISRFSKFMLEDMKNKESGNLSDEISYMFLNHFYYIPTVNEDGSDAVVAIKTALEDKDFMTNVEAALDKIDRTNVISAGYIRLFKEYGDITTASIMLDLIDNPERLDNILKSAREMRAKAVSENDARVLERLTPSKLRSYERAVGYLKSFLVPSDKIGGMSEIALYCNLGDPQKRNEVEKAIKGIINGQISGKFPVAADAAGLNDAMDLVKIYYGNAYILRQSSSVLKNCSSVYQWSTILVIAAMLIAVLSLVGLFALRGNTVLIALIGCIAVVVLFWMAMKISFITPDINGKVLLSKVLAVTGAGPVIAAMGLLLVVLGAMLCIKKLTNRQFVVIFGAFIVLFGFFLPWIGRNPDVSLAWKSGFNFLLDPVKLDLWDMSSAVYLAFPVLAIVAALLAIFVKKSGLALFLLSMIALGFFTGWVYNIAMTETFWAAGIAVVVTGYSTILIGNSINS